MKEIDITPQTPLEKFMMAIVSIVVFGCATVLVFVAAISTHNSYDSWVSFNSAWWALATLGCLGSAAILYFLSIAGLYDLYKLAKNRNAG